MGPAPNIYETVMTTVCLTMIVKNEEARIKRCLHSALPHVDVAYFIDTGSSDSTIAAIECEMKKVDKPYALLQRPWVDFAFNRNQVLNHAQDYSKCNYLLLLDADHELVVGDPDYRSRLTAPAYNIWQEDHGYEYANIRLVRSDVASRYVGVTHEVLVLPDGMKAETLPRDVIRIIDHADGANREGKFQRDIDLLYAQPNLDARGTFYLAQSYRDNDDPGLARLFYAKRMAMGGWEEECWYAQYQAARMTELMEEFPPWEVTHAYLMAYARRPWRAEPLWHLARYWRKRNEPYVYDLFKNRADELSYPPRDDVLFIEQDCYLP